MSGEINKRLEEIKSSLSPQQLAKVAYKEFYKITPFRSGNAKSNTDLRNNRIEADYPYAQRLDDGWSKQAPRGMTEPTVKYIKEYIKKQEK